MPQGLRGSCGLKSFCNNVREKISHGSLGVGNKQPACTSGKTAACRFCDDLAGNKKPTICGLWVECGRVVDSVNKNPFLSTKYPIDLPLRGGFKLVYRVFYASTECVNGRLVCQWTTCIPTDGFYIHISMCYAGIYLRSAFTHDQHLLIIKKGDDHASP